MEAARGSAPRPGVAMEAAGATWGRLVAVCEGVPAREGVGGTPGGTQGLLTGMLDGIVMRRKRDEEKEVEGCANEE